MMETTALDVAHCTQCNKNVVIAQDLSEHDELIDICVHCSTPLQSSNDRKTLGGYALRALGYTVEGEGPDSEGCGGGGCGSCGST